MIKLNPELWKFIVVISIAYWTLAAAQRPVLQTVQQPVKRPDLGFGFPDSEGQDKRMENAQNKLPVFIPTKCKDNELLYPGDQKDDWVCDCKPGFLYHPNTDQCYDAYRKGPCPNPNEYLVLPDGKVVPECHQNRCERDGQIWFQQACHTFGSAGPCALPELTFVVAVNVTTLEIACIKQSSSIKSRFGEDEEEDVGTEEEFDLTKCYVGGQRFQEGKCIS